MILLPILWVAVLMINNISMILNYSFLNIFLQCMSQDSGPVFKGKKMPGRMGGSRKESHCNFFLW